ncbi:ABC transporter permease [Streptomyces celluloflavus]
MASTETEAQSAPGSGGATGAGESAATAAAGPAGAAPGGPSGDLAGLEAGLDALDAAVADRQPWLRTVATKAFPPLIAVVIVLGLWQLAYHFALKPHYLLPSPVDVGRSLQEKWLEGTLLSFVWTSVSRGALGFLASVAIGTALGLVVAQVKVVRAAIGPILSGLQSLPSVAWVPAAIIWFGLSDATIYAVVLLGAVPSIANGLVSGVDQISPLYLRAGGPPPPRRRGKGDRVAPALGGAGSGRARGRTSCFRGTASRPAASGPTGVLTIHTGLRSKGGRERHDESRSSQRIR